MTLRDWFAGQAVSGIIAGSIEVLASEDPIKWRTYVAGAAYEIADAMLKEREK